MTLKRKGVIVDQQAYQQARACYQAGDWARAASMLSSCKLPGELCGEADHLLGNSLMKLGMFNDAAAAYASALNDINYGKKGALACNRARALVACGMLDEAIASINDALEDQTYPTPYKAYMTLGNALARKGAIQDAGVAFRNAAIDETNPDPAKSLVKLGGCFLEMNRSLDAIEAYRTALDFASPTADSNEIYEKLGKAYFAANKMNEAIDAFNQSMSDGTHLLSPEAKVAYDAASRAVAAIGHNSPSETDQMLAAAGYGPGGMSAASVDPLDPLGQSGELIPSADDTGFFSVTEEDLMQASAPAKKKKKGGFGKFLIVLLIILALASAAGGYAYYMGYGWPTQQAVVESAFQAQTDNGDLGAYISENVSSEMRKKIDSSIPASATVAIDGVDQNMSESTVRATATLSQGGKQTYEFKMIRDGISWKIVSVDMVFASMEDSQAAAQAPDMNQAENQEQLEPEQQQDNAEQTQASQGEPEESPVE